MTPKRSWVLVIDASVLRSAGTSEHSVSRACRACLEGVREICHRVILTPALSDEWKRHRSGFSAKWMASMTAKKKIVRAKPARRMEPIDTQELTSREIRALGKDVHLLEAALAADRVIVTCDAELQDILAKTRRGARLLRKLRWIDPTDCRSQESDLHL